MLASLNFSGNVHETVCSINRMGLDPFFHSVHYMGNGSIAVFNLPDYETYECYCKRVGREIKTREAFSKGEA